MTLTFFCTFVVFVALLSQQLLDGLNLVQIFKSLSTIVMSLEKLSETYFLYLCFMTKILAKFQCKTCMLSLFVSRLKCTVVLHSLIELLLTKYLQN